MVIEGIDLSSGNKVLAEVNPLKKSVSLLEKGRPSKKIYGLPVEKTLFRLYRFPTKNREKVHQALISHLKHDLPVSLDEVEFDYLFRTDGNHTEVFCVIAKKEDLKKLDRKSSVDSEVFALIRLMKQKKISDFSVVHFAPAYRYLLKVKDGFPVFIKTLGDEELKLYINEDTYVSGFIPEGIKGEVLNNPTGKPENNVAFGLVLKALDDTGVDLLHSDTGGMLKHLLKGALYLLIAVVLINTALFAVYYFKNKELAVIKEKEKEIFIKYFGEGTPVYDPLLQAKGIVAGLKSSGMSQEDAVDLLNYIGKSKKDAGISEIYKISLSQGMFTIYGKASSIRQVEKFKNLLSEKFSTTIEETVNTPAGDVRFIIKGKVK
ncbi:hypothetical protein [Persephonella sp.]